LALVVPDEKATFWWNTEATVVCSGTLDDALTSAKGRGSLFDGTLWKRLWKVVGGCCSAVVVAAVAAVVGASVAAGAAAV
ncbi:hypothetical protein PFISCL1PPCAC_975, partial [Pristionchus fissidentatus]